MEDRAKKEFVAKCVKEALGIAERLYKANPRRYKPLFACVNKAIKQHRSVVLVLQAMKRLEEKDDPSIRPAGYSGQSAPPSGALDPTEYFFATLRKLEQERDSKRLRRGGAIENPKALDALAEMMRRAGYRVEKT